MTVNARELFRREEYLGLQQTNWVVITGGPSTGKSELLKYLASCGYNMMPEAARVIIDERLEAGETIEEIRGDNGAFQQEVLERKELWEDSTPEGELWFWDRGLHGDSMAYWVNPGEEIEHDMYPEEMVTVLKRRYKQIFMLDPLSIYDSNDTARIESADEAAQVHNTIRLMYELLGYEIINVPFMSIEDRARFVIDHLQKMDQTVDDLLPQ